MDTKNKSARSGKPERRRRSWKNASPHRHMSSKPRKAPADKPDGTMHFENIEALIDGNGDITVGSIGPIRCAATAADQDQCLAMLQRRPGESLLDLLRRLDAAIDSAYSENIYIDEINPAPSPPPKRARKSRR